MIKIKFQENQFDPHPAGTHQGRIVEVEDKGQIETQFGLKPKLAIKIESDSAKTESGRPFWVWKWVNSSGSTKSTLYKIRRTLAGRDLTRDERLSFSDTELVDRTIGYQVAHISGLEGGTFVSVESIWPLEVDPGAVGKGEESDLPF